MNAKAARSAQRLQCHVPQAAFRPAILSFIVVHVNILSCSYRGRMWWIIGIDAAIAECKGSRQADPFAGLRFFLDTSILCYNSATVSAKAPARGADLLCTVTRQGHEYNHASLT